MTEFNISIFANLISALIVFPVAQVAGEVWRKSIVPWFEEKAYADAQIEGKWTSRVTYSTGPDDWDEFVVTIHRNGHRVEADHSCTAGANVGHDYAFKGTFGSLILTGSYASKDVARVARGTLTLRLLKNGTSLEGVEAIYSPRNDSIFNAKVVAVRQV